MGRRILPTGDEANRDVGDNAENRDVGDTVNGDAKRDVGDTVNGDAKRDVGDTVNGDAKRDVGDIDNGDKGEKLVGLFLPSGLFVGRLTLPDFSFRSLSISNTPQEFF